MKLLTLPCKQLRPFFILNSHHLITNYGAKTLDISLKTYQKGYSKIKIGASYHVRSFFHLLHYFPHYLKHQKWGNGKLNFVGCDLAAIHDRHQPPQRRAKLQPSGLEAAIARGHIVGANDIRLVHLTQSIVGHLLTVRFGWLMYYSYCLYNSLLDVCIKMMIF